MNIWILVSGEHVSAFGYETEQLAEDACRDLNNLRTVRDAPGFLPWRVAQISVLTIASIPKVKAEA